MTHRAQITLCLDAIMTVRERLSLNYALNDEVDERLHRLSLQANRWAKTLRNHDMNDTLAVKPSSVKSLLVLVAS